MKPPARTGATRPGPRSKRGASTAANDPVRRRIRINAKTHHTHGQGRLCWLSRGGQFPPHPSGRGRVAHFPKRQKKVKSATPPPDEKVKFPTPPEPEKVKTQTDKPLELLGKAIAKVVHTKERKEKADTPASLSPVHLKRLGLTPGSIVWNLLLGSDAAGQQTPET
jgi:hypothetical protein